MNDNPTVLVDTSYLISLSDNTRPNHDAAKKYHREFIRRTYTMHLSTIVISEYQQKQPITDLINSGNYIPLPFNFDDALRTAEAAFNLGGIQRDTGERANAKDDLKLIGQAVSNNITYIITDDDRTMYRYTKRLNDAGMIGVRPIKLSDGFDMTIFNNGQASMEV